MNHRDLDRLLHHTADPVYALADAACRAWLKSQQHQRNGDQGRWKEAQDDQTNHAHAMLRLCGALGIET